jgi:BON domain
MSPIRYRDEGSSSGIILGAIVGALAGFAAGMYLAQNGGRDRSRLARTDGGSEHAEGIRGARDEEDEYEEEELEDTYAADEYEDDEEDYDITLEERVLEAFRNDPILSTRAVDIGSLRTGVIELAGVVDTAQEAQHAVTIARGVPGVQSVVNRIVTGIHEPRYHEAAKAGRHQASDVERTVSDSRPVRGDMPERPTAPSTPPNVIRADQASRDASDTP